MIPQPNFVPLTLQRQSSETETKTRHLAGQFSRATSFNGVSDTHDLLEHVAGRPSDQGIKESIKHFRPVPLAMARFKGSRTGNCLTLAQAAADFFRTHNIESAVVLAKPTAPFESYYYVHGGVAVQGSGRGASSTMIFDPTYGPLALMRGRRGAQTMYGDMKAVHYTTQSGKDKVRVFSNETAAADYRLATPSDGIASAFVAALVEVLPLVLIKYGADENPAAHLHLDPTHQQVSLQTDTGVEKSWSWETILAGHAWIDDAELSTFLANHGAPAPLSADTMRAQIHAVIFRWPLLEQIRAAYADS